LLTILRNLKDLKEFVDEIHSYGSKVFIQLSAGLGRNFPLTTAIAENYDQLNGPMQLDKLLASADEGLPNRWINAVKTKSLSREDIHELVEKFAEAAHVLQQFGIDGIDVHAVHEGYLLDQFAMKYTNHRFDEYGGSLENRLRFACEIVQSIKEKCGEDYPVTLRYSVTSRVRDFNKGIIPADDKSVEIGRDLEESKQAVQILNQSGL